MKNERFKMIASVYILFVRDDKVLMSRRFNTGYEDGNYGLVAGHVEDNESLTCAAIREAKEEAGVDIAPEDLEVKTTMHRRQEDIRVDFLFEAQKWGGEITNMEPERCDDLSWFPLDALPANTIPYTRQVIENYRKGIIYSEWGW
jgi:8-oxo-dGTP diphosphatase